MYRIILSELLCLVIWLWLPGLATAQQQAGQLAATHRYKVRVERNILIPMRDGINLAADIFRPDGGGKFPVILEYIPYRKDDGSLDLQRRLAEYGFVGVRLDVRGTGESEGVNTDEYMPQEQEDGYDAVEWLARQPWSNGNVGMIGISYGGFTCIQVAMHQPPHLKAIVPVDATDDRYTDDCHYTRGGTMRMYYDVGTYGGNMVAMNAVPPFPELAGERWSAIWTQHLENNQPYLLTWMKQQVDGSYWRHASLRPDYDRIKCPVFLIDGWHDGYANAELRTYTQLKVPKKLLIGPWIHNWPDGSVPGPRIDFLKDVVRFFGHWLSGEETDITKDPPVTFYMQEYSVPNRTLDIIPGCWRNDTDFPAPGTKDTTFYLADDGKLISQPRGNSRAESDEYDYIPTVGVSGGYWSAGGIRFYLPDDQRTDEAYSLIYTTPPFEQTVRILGWPQVILYGSSSAQVVSFVAKLADVAPDGHSALIVDGSLNGTRRESLANPTPMKPGQIYKLDVPMYPTGWVLRPGHRLRVALSSSDFPNLWPTPESAHVHIYRGGPYTSRIVLPVAPESNLPPPHFSFLNSRDPDSDPSVQEVIYDQFSGNVTVANHATGTWALHDNLGTMSHEQDFRCSANSRDPVHASIVGLHKYILEREDGRIEVSSTSSIRATKTAFHILIDLNVTRNGKPFFHKEWMATEPRRLL